MSTSRSIVRAARRGQQAKRRMISQHLHTFTGRVYVASPIQTYTTPCYDTMLARVRVLLPNAELIPARDCFTSNADWRQRWPALLRTLDALIFFDHQGSIGRGVFQEIEDAQATALPVFYLPHAAADLLP